MPAHLTLRTLARLSWLAVSFPGLVSAQDTAPPSFAVLKAEGAASSTYRAKDTPRAAAGTPTADLATFRTAIEPILAGACYRCHGPDKQKGDRRIDELDPDLFTGKDVGAWLDVLAVLNNGEMPPPGKADAALADADRRAVVDWLVEESRQASTVRRGTATHASVRRLSRYEFSYMLQDLLALSYDFADDLPPDAASRDGFENSSEVLQIGGVQFRAYLDAARKALELATYPAEQPTPLRWSVPMAALAEREWRRQEEQLEKARKENADDPVKLEAGLQDLAKRHRQRPGGVHFFDPQTDRRAGTTWSYEGAKYANAPGPEPVDAPEYAAGTTTIAVIPPRGQLLVELGDQLPERGTLRVRVRAARAAAGGDASPSLRLLFGWQASNNSSVTFAIGDRDLDVGASPEVPQVYTWDVPISGIRPRNSARGVQPLGGYPSPSEFLAIQNASWSGGDVLVDRIEVTAPVFASWPPPSHRAVFPAAVDGLAERDRARGVLAAFMPRAWRRPVGEDEIDRKLRLFERMRPDCDAFEPAMIEVLVSVLASPDFLLLGPLSGAPVEVAEAAAVAATVRLSAPELATRLSLFLWCSTPDDELRALAGDGRLADPAVLDAQVARMLADPKARRFSRQFVRQWLHLELLDFLHVDTTRYPRFDDELLAAMREEPIAFFAELLEQDLSALEFLHADFALVNERLAQHYGLAGVVGNRFRRVAIDPASHRGGLLAQAGLLAMNSDGKDSHPLKRGVWLLERLLDDPPPPPPAAVPKIDLADPEVAKLTLKQRLERHRNAPACLSCHAKIDPWGIALEQFDATGGFRDEIGGKPVDASAELFNAQRLDGIDGLKRFLLQHRQDQFVRALVVKLLTYGLGRPLTFADRAEIDRIVGEARRRGDGLATIVRQIAASPLYLSR